MLDPRLRRPDYPGAARADGTERSQFVVGAAAGCAAGLLIGSIGVGGIIIVPILIQMHDVNVRFRLAFGN